MSERRDEPFFFTWTAQRGARPLSLAGGRGAWFWGEDGERWLDLGSLVYQVNAGHGHRGIVEAVRAQAERLCVGHPRAVYPEKRRLAEELLQVAPPGFGRVFFTLGGAEANENALKIARLVTGRYKVVSRYRSYHGATLGAVTLTGDWRRAPVEPGIAGVAHVLDWDCPSCPFGVRAPDCDHEPLTWIPRVLEEEGDVGAVVIEVVVGHNGVLLPPPGYLQRVRQACDRHGALLVFDEVLTGFGRTGRWLALEHFGVVPDIVTLGKGLTSGYGPLGAVLVREAIAEHFEERVLAAGLTHYAHPLGVAAALGALRAYREEGLVERAAETGRWLAARLDELQRDSGGRVRQFRSLGLLAGLELQGYETPEAWARLLAALEARRLFVPNNARHRMLLLAPPLCIERTELQQGLEGLLQALRETAGT